MVATVSCLGFAVAAEAQRNSNTNSTDQLPQIAGISPGIRRPVAVAQLSGCYWVANSRTGTVTGIGSDWQVLSETRIGEQLSDLISLPAQQCLAAIDTQANQLIVVHPDEDYSISIVERHTIPGGPRAIVTLDEGRQLIIAARWAHRLNWLAMNPADAEDSAEVGCAPEEGPLAIYRDEEHLDLPFAPGAMIVTPNSRWLVVADFSGPYLAVVDLVQRSLLRVVQLPGHNLHGLGIRADGRELLVSHQMLNDFIPTSRDHVFWGNVLSNMLRTLVLEDLCQPGSCVLTDAPKLHGTLVPLGREGLAAGDPRSVCVSQVGDVLVAIAGTGELAFRPADGRQFTRMHVGQRPIDVLPIDGTQRALVVNNLDDTLAVVDLDSQTIERRISLGPAAKLTDVDRGEQLFYDATLSLHGWFSCHSCHTEGHTCGLLNDNLGDDSYGAPKRIPSLLGTSGTAPWAWNGSQAELTTQIEKSLRKTMHSDETHEIRSEDVAALAAYLSSLPPAISLDEARGRSSKSQIAEGARIFTQYDCAQCHRPPTYTSPETYDVGLHDERGLRRFNPPSLRGVSQRGRWLHDGRCLSLGEVLDVHPLDGGLELSPASREALIAFLESL